MSSIAREAFNLEQKCGNDHIRETIFEDQEAHSQAINGLRILTYDDQHHFSNNNNNILLKRPAFSGCNMNGRRLSQPAASAHDHINSTGGVNGSFLKSCCLCKTTLRRDKDIYMYRGDQGYCSIKCRNKQIVRDEMAEIIEINERRRSRLVSSPQECHHEGQHCSETCKILQDMRQRRKNRLLSQTDQTPLVPLVRSLFT